MELFIREALLLILAFILFYLACKIYFHCRKQYIEELLGNFTKSKTNNTEYRQAIKGK